MLRGLRHEGRVLRIKGFYVHVGIKHRGDSYRLLLTLEISMSTCVCCLPSLVIPSDCHLEKVTRTCFKCAD